MLNSRGAIILEFAICMPVLIILLFYIHDLMRIKRLYSQTEFVAQQMANILQNISQGREDKKINRQDIQYAASLAFLSMYPGKTIYADGQRGTYSHELSHYPQLTIHFVEGLSDGKASCRWHLHLRCSQGTAPNGWALGTYNSFSVVKCGTNVALSNYPTLKIREGEMKIMVDSSLHLSDVSMSKSDYNSSDDKTNRAKKAFRCRLIPLKDYSPASSDASYFSSISVFTPKPELFSETKSPQ